MPAKQKYCKIHGAYSSTYQDCPHCSGSLPRNNPQPDAEDEAPTEFNTSSPAKAHLELEGATEIGAGYHAIKRSTKADLDETEFSSKFHTEIPESDIEYSGVLGYLIVKEGIRRGRVHTIKDGMMLGRSMGEIEIDDPQVSNPHVRFVLENDQFILWDCGSHNGTFVNGARIRAATPLKENDLVKIGETTFVFKLLG